MPRPWKALGTLTTREILGGRFDEPQLDDEGRISLILDRSNEYKIAYVEGHWVIFSR